MVQTNLSTGERWMIAVEEAAAEVWLMKCQTLGEKTHQAMEMQPKVPEPGHSEVPMNAEATDGLRGKVFRISSIFSLVEFGM